MCSDKFGNYQINSIYTFCAALFQTAGVVQTASSINYETLTVAERTVLITVTVRDTGALSDTTTLTVSIIDQNEAPAFPKTTYTLVTDEAGVNLFTNLY